MNKIVPYKQLDSFLKNIFNPGGNIVLVGGCFDIIHIGHIRFLEESKKLGNVLILLLENDEKVKKLKGPNRPVFSQEERAEVLSALECVNYIILLPEFKTDRGYHSLVGKLQPAVIAVTENDPMQMKKVSQAREVNGRVVAIPHVKTYSSSRLAGILGIE